MTDLISASPLIILIGLAALAWFTDSKILKLATAGIFFLYPVILGKVELPSDPSQITNYIADIVSYWLTEALEALVEYLREQLSI